ncbi:MAG: PP2C family protein-serine/threonine phosphatase [Actinomycetota bacterium]
MREPDRSLLRLLDRLDSVGLSGLMPVLLDHLAPIVGAVGVRLLIADIEARKLEVREGLQAGEVPRSQEIEIEGSVHGRAYTAGGVAQAEIDGRSVLITPVTARRERQGVLEVSQDRAPTVDDVDVVETLGVLFGYLVTAGDLWTDEFHFARRRRDMTLAAEIQWSLLPLAAFSSKEISIAGALEPAYEVGGDAFDYACSDRTLTLAVFDSMGHGLGAARLSSLCVATFRNARRAGRTILEQADRIHEVLLPGFEREGYTTGAILSIDLASPERTVVVNAGHEQPFLQRGDAAPVQIGLRPEIPFGMPFPVHRETEALPLRQGDRLTLFSDGIIEARPDGGEIFGLESLERILAENRGLSARETARVATCTARDHRAAHLEDDATIVIVDIL